MDVLIGGALFAYKPHSGLQSLSDKQAVQSILDEFKKRGYINIDTARNYSEGTSEVFLSDLGVFEQGFIVDTKILSTTPGCHTKANIEKSIQESLAALKTGKIRTLYLHHPDTVTPYEETLEAINEAFKKGLFEKFGISNYTADQVDRIVQIAKEKGWVQPTVYQGLYNLVCRTNEKELFPVLRKHGISFIAYSILGGSFLTDAINKEYVAAPQSRFDATARMGKVYRDYFFKDSNFQALEKLKVVARKYNLSVPEISIRWIVHHSILDASRGDAIITGSSKLQNVKNNLEWAAKPPLPEEVVKVTEEVWDTLKDSSPAYVMH